jgi:hypothetical protein
MVKQALRQTLLGKTCVQNTGGRFAGERLIGQWSLP